ncbi:MAG: glycosyltransferase [Sporichthyaceae bacterium]
MTEQGVRCVVTDARFGTDADGNPAALDASNAPAAWKYYTRTGEPVRILARVNPQPGSGALTMSGPVQVGSLPHCIGLVKLILRTPALLVALNRELSRAGEIVLRVPGPISSLAALICRGRRLRYGVDVAADMGALARSGSLGRGLSMLARAMDAHIRWIVSGASSSRYVTQEALQRVYPPAPDTPTVGVSDVCLGVEGLRAEPRAWQPGRHRLISVGTMEVNYKAQDVVLDAARQLLDRGYDIEVVLVGQGRMRPEFEAQVARLALTDRVVFTGNIADRAELIERLDSASVFVMPSRMEGLPRAMVEAMARALPSVASNVGGIPELLDWRCVVKPDDPIALAQGIARLLDDPVRWEQESARNLATAKTFDEVALQERFTDWAVRIPAARGDRHDRLPVPAEAPEPAVWLPRQRQTDKNAQTGAGAGGAFPHQREAEAIESAEESGTGQR